MIDDFVNVQIDLATPVVDDYADRVRILGAIALLGDEGVDTSTWTDADLIAWYDRHRVERVTCERTRDAVHPDEALDELVRLEREARRSP